MERWKTVKGTCYDISSYGRLRNNTNNYILKPLQRKTGYYEYCLVINKKKTYFLAHRLVAINFLDNKENYPCVNHKDENKQNNCVDNLEWCTYKYNSNYGKCAFIRNSKVLMMNLNGDILKEYSSMKEASEENNLYYQGISSVCRGFHKTCGGFKWSYVS